MTLNVTIGEITRNVEEDGDEMIYKFKISEINFMNEYNYEVYRCKSNELTNLLFELIKECIELGNALNPEIQEILNKYDTREVEQDEE